jgi:alpha-1,3/alpha-1,6-mannosyltransferase
MSLRIAFVHPVLGLGGAERLVVDAALEMQARGHRAVIFTAELDPERAFPATVDGSLEVRVHGAFIPLTLAGRAQAACTLARLGVLAAAVARDAEGFDVIVPHAVPLLRRLARARGGVGAPRMVYYCHFPDFLLAPARRNGAYRLYRGPIDWFELRAMRSADRVLVNSRYTGEVLADLGLEAHEVVYPGIDVEAYASLGEPPRERTVILSIGRFDDRKNHLLSVEALARLRTLVPPAEFERVELVIAGGYDPHLRESAETVRALERRASELSVTDKLRLCRSPREPERLAFLEQARCVVHPMSGEHFGLVPVEAMAAGRPVVAAANGGPLETIVDGETGYLRPPTPAAFAEALAALVTDPEGAARMGRASRARARRFSRAAFGDAFEASLERAMAR